ncbi:hypothetical protein NVP2096O_24 [Vibrio phage 2.096.O._10N.286.48.B5]|nr:hypothetical protein NVP2096O_24 [Vibrio phage 2.096.O._10N.286.48.B5]
MASLAKAIFDRAAKDVNRILGDSFTYINYADSSEIERVMITVNRNKKVVDTFGNLIGYRVEASILKSEVPNRPQPRDTFTDGSVTWRVGEVTIENLSKWYIDVQEI